MMNIDEAIIAYLKAHTGLKALVGARIFFEVLPQGTAFPAVVIQKISDIKDHYLTGQAELERPIYQFTAMGLTKASARLVTNQLKSALCDYQGTLSGVVVQKIELQNEISSLEKTPDGILEVYYEDLEFEVNFIRS